MNTMAVYNNNILFKESVYSTDSFLNMLSVFRELSKMV